MGILMWDHQPGIQNVRRNMSWNLKKVLRHTDLKATSGDQRCDIDFNLHDRPNDWLISAEESYVLRDNLPCVYGKADVIRCNYCFFHHFIFYFIILQLIIYCAFDFAFIFMCDLQASMKTNCHLSVVKAVMSSVTV